MKKDYSPAPWRACHDGKCHCGLVWSTAIDSVVAYTVDTNDNELGDGCKIEPKSNEFYANMRLIAAAPELLASLESVLEFLESPRFKGKLNKMRQQMIDDAKLAVKKAYNGTTDGI